jgi:hypothetical protein
MEVEGPTMNRPYTLPAHSVCDTLLGCHQRFRELLKAAQRGEYTRVAFEQSFQDIAADMPTSELILAFSTTANDLPD